MLFEDDLFVYPLGNNFDNLQGMKKKKDQCWNTNSTVNTLFS